MDVEDYFYIDGDKSLNLKYFANHIKLNTTTNNLEVNLKEKGGISSDNTGIYIEKFDNHFKIDNTGTDSGKLKLKFDNGGISADLYGIYIDKYDNHFIIDASGADDGKLKLAKQAVAVDSSE